METLLGNEAAGRVLTKDTACPSLTVKQRFYGFISCFLFGTFCSILSIGGILMAFLKPTKFAILYSLGNLSSIGSTLFLIGPKSQCKRMFKQTRFVATCLFLLSLIGTIVFVFVVYDSDNKIWWHKLVLLLLIFLQFCTLIWYTLSYIPFGRKICKKICCAICCSEEEEGVSVGGETKS